MNDMKHYLALPYAIEIIPDEGGYVATVPDLPGCMSHGETIDEALRGVEEAKELWLEGRLEAGQEIPEPAKIEEFSGKFVLRIPRSLHRTLDSEARKQGVSLNQHVLHILSERHHLGGLQGKLETALDQLVAGRDWRSWETHYTCPRNRLTARAQEQGNLQMLYYIRKPPRSYKGRHRQPDYGEISVPTRERTPVRADTYTDFVRSLKLLIVAMTRSSFRIKRDEFFDEKESDLSTAVVFKSKRVSKNSFDLQADLVVKLTGKQSRTLFELSATYELHFHGKPPLDARLVRRFADSDARLVVWPYFREYVSDVSARMYVPPILLPLSK